MCRDITSDFVSFAYLMDEIVTQKKMDWFEFKRGQK